MSPLPLVSHLIKGQSLLSEPQFPLENGENNHTYSIELLLQLNETMTIQGSGQSLAQCESSGIVMGLAAIIVIMTAVIIVMGLARTGLRHD